MSEDRTRDSIVVRGGAKACYAIAVDFDDYPRWEKNTKTATIKAQREGGTQTEVYFEFETPVKLARYTLLYDQSRAPEYLEFDFLEGDLKEMNGAWKFDEASDGETTTVTYEMSVAPSFPLPKAIKKTLEKRMARAALKNLKERVEAGN